MDGTGLALFSRMNLPAAARHFASAVILAGAAVLALSLRQMPAAGWAFAGLLLLAVASSAIKIRLSLVDGYFTLNFLFLLAGVAFFSLPETVAACVVSGLAMSLLNNRSKPAPVQVAFNVANLVISGSVAYLAGRELMSEGLSQYRPAWFAMVTTVYFVVNTSLVAGILSLVSDETFGQVNGRYYVTYFPYYLIGAAAVGLLPAGGSRVNVESWLLLLPAVYLAYFLHSLAKGKAAGSLTAVVPVRARRDASRFAIAVASTGAILLVLSLIYWQSADAFRFATLLVLALAVSVPQVSLPGLRGTISAGIVLVLAAVIDLSLSESILMSAAVSLPAAFGRVRNRKIHPLVAMSASIIASAFATIVCRWPLAPWLHDSLPAAMLIAALLVGGIHSALIGTSMWLAEGRPAVVLLERFFYWSIPCYLTAAAVAGLMVATWRSGDWWHALLAMPVVAMAGISYRLHVRNAATTLAKA